MWTIICTLLIIAIALMVVIPALWLVWTIFRFVLNGIAYLICGEDELF